jgi:hypothetical protein
MNVMPVSAIEGTRETALAWVSVLETLIICTWGLTGVAIGIGVPGP